MNHAYSDQWLLTIGELILRGGDITTARLHAQQYAEWRDGQLTMEETLAGARASVSTILAGG